MNFCKYCGTALKDDALFCPACGKGNLPGDVKTAVPQGAPPEDLPTQMPNRDYLKVDPMPKKRVPVLTVILAALLVLSLAANGFFAYKLFFEKPGTEEETAAQSEEAPETGTAQTPASTAPATPAPQTETVSSAG